MTNSQPAAVAIGDWGTTRLRLWLLDANGNTVAERRSDEGLLSAQPDGFAAILERHLSDMGAPDTMPVVLCGMVGSRQGWLEAPYVDTPASLSQIFAGAVRIPGAGRDIRIVPGLAQRTVDAPDVMRGEETQLSGAGETLLAGQRIVCMPGTHSKWVSVADGAVTGFQTFMTGELFSVLSGHSILRHAVGQAPEPVSPNSPGFAAACAGALADGGDISTRLFRLRAATLLQGLGQAEAAAALSGLLIGGEIASARRTIANGAESVVLVASGAMRALYETALGLAGLAVEVVDADAAVSAGLRGAARHHGMLKG